MTSRCSLPSLERRTTALLPAPPHQEPLELLCRFTKRHILQPVTSSMTTLQSSPVRRGSQCQELELLPHPRSTAGRRRTPTKGTPDKAMDANAAGGDEQVDGAGGKDLLRGSTPADASTGDTDVGAATVTAAAAAVISTNDVAGRAPAVA